MEKSSPKLFIGALIVLGIVIWAASSINRATGQNNNTKDTTATVSTTESVVNGTFIPSNVYTTYNQGRLSRLNTETGKMDVVSIWNFPVAPMYVRWSPNQSSALVQIVNSADDGTNTAWIIPGRTIGDSSWWLINTEGQNVPLTSGITNPVWKNDGTKIFYTYIDPNTIASPKLTVADPNGTNWQTLSDLGAIPAPTSIEISPTGLWAAFTTVAADRTQMLYAIGVSSKKLMQLTPSNGVRPGRIKWNSNKDQLFIESAGANENAPSTLLSWIPESAALTELSVASYIDQIVSPKNNADVLYGIVAGKNGTSLTKLDLKTNKITEIKNLLPNFTQIDGLYMNESGSNILLRSGSTITNIPAK